MAATTIYFISLLLAACGIASAARSCRGDLIASKTRPFLDKTCDNPTGDIKSDKVCTKCVCPYDDLLRFNQRCYKPYECPQKSMDGISNSIVGHNFVVPGQVNAMNEVYGMHFSAIKLSPHWYHSVALFKIVEDSCAAAVKAGHAKDINNHLTINYRVPTKLVDLLRKGHTFLALFGTGAGTEFKPVAQCNIRVENVLDLRRYKPDEAHPINQKYLLFGDSTNAYISHIPTRCRDFQQVASLSSIPAGFSNRKLRAGAVISLPELEESSLVDNNNNIPDPLVQQSYRAKYLCTGARNGDEENDAVEELAAEFDDVRSENCKETEINIQKKDFFDSRIVNIGCP